MITRYHPITDIRNLAIWFVSRATRRCLPLVITLLLIATVAFAVVHYFSKHAMQQVVSQALQSILHAKVTAFENWKSQSLTSVNRTANSPHVYSIAHAILRRSASGVSLSNHIADESVKPAPDANPADLEKQKLAANIARASSAKDYLGWAVIDIDGRVVHSDHEQLVAKQLAIPAESLDKVIGRQSVMTRPFLSPRPLGSRPRQDSIEASQAMQPELPTVLLAVLVPIADGARTLGCIAWLMDPRDQFSKLFLPRDDPTLAECYAMDRYGFLLSSSRFEDQMREIGMLSGEVDSTSILAVQVTDPGFELLNSGPLDRETLASLRENAPLTELAIQATRGGTGQNVVGYRGYRGVEVVGAWTWLSEQEFAVATELEVAQVYSPLQSLRLITWFLIGALGILAASLVGLRMFGDVLHKRLLGEKPVRQLGQYLLGRQIGCGAMGAVYAGTHRLLKREVAIKVLEPDDLTPTMKSRFTREVQLTSQLRHPNTISIFDYGCTEDGTHYYVMEYLDGITLQELIEQYGAQRPGRVIMILLQICGSLSEAHHRGIIHRDIKPANLFLTTQAGIDDLVKVLDFGLVKEIARETIELTRTDSITGTPMYMSPESVRDASTVDTRSDLYAVGAVGYALLAGMPIFESAASVDICLKQLNEEPSRPADRLGSPLPEELQNVLMSCLRKDPAQRPQSMAVLADSLRHCQRSLDERSEDWSTMDAMRWWTEEFKGRDPSSC